MTGILVYAFIALVWFVVACMEVHFKRTYGGDEAWPARFALMAPIWPLVVVGLGVFGLWRLFQIAFPR